MAETLRPPLPDKEFFNIGETCRIAQIPAYTLRYWEEQFRALRPVRRESGHRRYTRRDLETIFRIKELVQVRKMTVAGARKALVERARARPAAEPSSQAVNVSTLKLLREVREDLRRILDELR